MKIIKRDGREVPFDYRKIKSAMPPSISCGATASVCPLFISCFQASRGQRAKNDQREGHCFSRYIPRQII